MRLLSLPFILILILLAINIYLTCKLKTTIKLHTENNRKTIDIIKSKDFEKKETEAALNSTLEYLYIADKKLNDINIFPINLKLTDKSEKERKIKTVVTEKKIVFRFFQTSCTTCVLDQIKNLNLLAKKIGREKVVLITDNLSKDVLTICQMSNIDLNIYETRNENLGLIYDKNQTPYLFLLDKDLLVQKPFIVSTLTRGLDKKFYDSIAGSF